MVDCILFYIHYVHAVNLIKHLFFFVSSELNIVLQKQDAVHFFTPFQLEWYFYARRYANRAFQINYVRLLVFPVVFAHYRGAERNDTTGT